MSLGHNNTVDGAKAGDGRREGVPSSMFAALFWKQQGWLGTSIQQLWPAQRHLTCQTLADVKVGMFPPWQAAASSTAKTGLLSFSFLSQWHTCCHSLPFHLARFLCGCTRDSYMSCALLNVFFRSDFSNLSLSLSNCAPNNTVCHLFVRAIMDQMGNSLICSGLLSQLVLGLLFSRLSEDVLLFIWSEASNLCSG